MMLLLFAISCFVCLFFTILIAALITGRQHRTNRHQARNIKLYQQEMDRLEGEIEMLKAQLETYKQAYRDLANAHIQAEAQQDWPEVING